ncbi:MAG: hypothetical protein ACYC27_01940 [Armatimonadota bacterium]
MNRLWKGIYLITAFALMILLVGCDDDDNELVRLDLKNLGQLSDDYRYAAWVQTNGNIALLDTFNTRSDNTASFSRFALLETLEEGDRVFVTIEPPDDPEPRIPSDTLVLDGTVSGNSAILNFPKLQQFQNASGTVRVLENNQILADFTNLPDVSDINFIYQGFLERNGSFFPLRRFNFNEEPVSDNIGFDPTTARYFLSIEPVPDFNSDRPYTIRPFFTVGNLVPEIPQELTRSPLSPDSANFRFPSGVATIRQ